MPLQLIENEIRRFLASSDPEVLCIVGGWGVGKTYAWKKYLADADASGTLAFGKYSYVSLFGLDSLDDLRFAVVQNTVTGDHILLDPDLGTFGALFAKGTDLARKLKPLVDLVLATTNRKGVSDVLKEASFLAVQNQLVCLDDLERAGKGLNARDTLGLASYLKESRKCKVVLLLNEEQMTPENRLEFNNQLEKVADISIRFDLSSEEAVNIALSGNGLFQELVKARAINLNITNIRVIRKIAKLAERLASILSDFDEPVLYQAIATLVPSCMSVYQPGLAPSLDDLLAYNNILDQMTKAGGDEREPNPWGALLDDYPFSHADEMDKLIIDGAAGGYFDEERLKIAATQVQAARRKSGEENPLSQAWKSLYHTSLKCDDEAFLQAVYDGVVATIEDVSFTNLNSAVYMLREFEGDARADELVRRYMEVHDTEVLNFFDLNEHVFGSYDDVDPALKSAFLSKAQSYVDPRNPLEVLKSLSNGGWNADDLLLMSKQSADDFEQLFEALDEVPFRRPIKTLLSMGRSGQSGSENILQAATEALIRIGKKSPIRERKVRGLGIQFPDDRQES